MFTLVLLTAAVPDAFFFLCFFVDCLPADVGMLVLDEELHDGIVQHVHDGNLVAERSLLA